MQLRKLIFLLAISAFLLPTIAKANEIEVRAGSVRVNTSRDGGIYVNSGRTNIIVPSIRSNPVNRLPNRNRYQSINCSRYRNSGYQQYSQQSTQIYDSGRTVVQSSVYTNRCR